MSMEITVVPSVRWIEETGGEADFKAFMAENMEAGTEVVIEWNGYYMNAVVKAVES